MPRGVAESAGRCGCPAADLPGGVATETCSSTQEAALLSHSTLEYSHRHFAYCTRLATQDTMVQSARQRRANKSFFYGEIVAVPAFRLCCSNVADRHYWETVQHAMPALDFAEEYTFS